MINILNLEEQLELLAEAMPKFFNVLDSDSRKFLVTDLVGMGFDLHNLPEPKEVKNKSSVTKLFKDTKTILIFCSQDESKNDIVITAGGVIVYDRGMNTYNTSIKRLKEVTLNAKTIYYIQVSQADMDKLQQKRDNRDQAKYGSVTKVDGERPYAINMNGGGIRSFALRTEIDKSGHVSNVKYRLAEKRLKDFDNYIYDKVPAFGRKLLKAISRQSKDFKLFRNYVDNAKRMYSNYESNPSDKYNYDMLIFALVHIDEIVTDFTKKYDIKH